MAHSSGGGSSGGGCHSGSSSNSSGNTYRRYDQYYFPGSHRYSYRDKDGNKQYIYCNQDPSKKHSLPWLFYIICFFFLFQLFQGSGDLLFLPKKIQNPSSQIVIEDSQNVIRDEEALSQILSAFYEETGVTPAVKTVSREQWSGNYLSLMDYAMDEYYNLFQDENHWLIVYSMETDPSGNLQKDQWQFEGIIGDDTGPSVNDWLCDQFTEEVHRNLKSMSDPGEAIGQSFQKLQYQRKHSFLSCNAGTLLAVISTVLLCAAPIIAGIVEIIQRRKYKNAVLDE